MTSPTPPVNPKIVNGIAVAVAVVWVTSFIADIFVKDYSPPIAIHAAFMLILGAIFGFQIVGRKNGDDGGA